MRFIHAKFGFRGRRSMRSGFSLVEIITVITIIVILLGLLVPAILSIQKKAKVAKSEALFGKLITALTLYRKDYGTYPDVAGTLSDGDITIALNNGEQWRRFTETLALSLPDGSAINNPQNNPELKKSNPKLKRYFDLQLSELETVNGQSRLVDAFGNPFIYIVVDANLDGSLSREVLPDSPDRDLRQRIVVYTLDEEDDDFPELRSWDS